MVMVHRIFLGGVVAVAVRVCCVLLCSRHFSKSPAESQIISIRHFSGSLPPNPEGGKREDLRRGGERSFFWNQYTPSVHHPIFVLQEPVAILAMFYRSSVVAVIANLQTRHHHLPTQPLPASEQRPAATQNQKSHALCKVMHLLPTPFIFIPPP